MTSSSSSSSSFKSSTSSMPSSSVSRSVDLSLRSLLLLSSSRPLWLPSLLPLVDPISMTESLEVSSLLPGPGPGPCVCLPLSPLFLVLLVLEALLPDPSPRVSASKCWALKWTMALWSRISCLLSNLLFSFLVLHRLQLNSLPTVPISKSNFSLKCSNA